MNIDITELVKQASAQFTQDINVLMVATRMDERERIIGILKNIRVGDDMIGRDYAIDIINGENNE